MSARVRRNVFSIARARYVSTLRTLTSSAAAISLNVREAHRDRVHEILRRARLEHVRLRPRAEHRVDAGALDVRGKRDHFHRGLRSGKMLRRRDSRYRA
jgi:hypothetical protein